MNYSKISGQLVCKMLVLLAFVFAACSDELSGGVTEETRVYALSGRVGDVYPKLIFLDSMADSSTYNNSVFVDKGSIIIVRELDSLTLDTTGRFFADTVDNDSGHFAFENLSLRSPYVLIENKVPYDTFLYIPRTEPSDSFYDPIVHITKYKEYSALVNLLNIKNVNVSTLTTAKIPLLQKYFAEGNSYAQASKMAEREILESFGIYEDLGSFEEMPEEDSELCFVNKMARLEDIVKRFDVQYAGVEFFFLSPKLFSMKNSVVERDYLNSMKMIGYEIGYLAHHDGLGRCTESRENEAGMVKGVNGYVAVVCHSGKWTIGFKTVEHTKGTMTDNRDGKTYKTVTYNFGGASQTWMAENLDFTDTTSLSIDSSLRANLSGGIRCYHENMDAACSMYGHEYQWKAAMNIGTDDIKVYSVGSQGDSILISKKCLDAYVYVNAYVTEPYSPELGSAMTVADSCNALLNRGNDSEDTPTRTWTWNYTDFITPENQNSYQGICPDGWRIPTVDDWMFLLQNLGEQYGVDGSRVVPVLYDETATGFGLHGVADILEAGLDNMVVQYRLYNYFVMADVSYYVAEFFNEWDVASVLDLEEASARHIFLYKYYNREWRPELLQTFPAYNSPAAVRCIKN